MTEAPALSKDYLAAAKIIRPHQKSLTKTRAETRGPPEVVDSNTSPSKDRSSGRSKDFM